MPAGRPTTLTKELIDEIEKWLLVCSYVETVIQYVGVHKDVYYGWLKRGNRELKRLTRDIFAEADPKEAIYLELAIRVKKAISKWTLDNLEAIQRARSQSWQAAAWLLERRFPEQWSRNAVEIKELQKQVELLTAHVLGIKEVTTPVKPRPKAPGR